MPALVLLAVTFALANGPQDPGFTVQSATDALRACIHDPSDPRCTEDAAIFLAGKYDEGDRSVLPILVRAGLHSDAALSEALGSFYADSLATNPEPLVREMAKYAGRRQQSLAALAASGDGSGLDEATFKAAVTKLEAFRNGTSGKARVTAELLLRVLKQEHRRPAN